MRTQLCHVLVNFGIFFYTAQVSYSSACLLNKKLRSNKFCHFEPASCIHLLSVLCALPFHHKVYRVEIGKLYETSHNLSLALVLVRHTEVLQSWVSSPFFLPTTMSSPYPLLYLSPSYIVHTFSCRSTFSLALLSLSS